MIKSNVQIPSTKTLLICILLIPFTSSLWGTSDTSKWETLYTNLAASPTSAVPGLMGFSFQPGNGTLHFDRIFVSPNGNYVFSAQTSFPNSEVLISNGALIALEGTFAPWTITENMGGFDTKLGINDAGTIVFANNTSGGATENDEYIVQRTAGGVFTAVAKEGDSASPPLPGLTWGGNLNSPVISSGGGVGFIVAGLGNATTATNAALIFNNTLLAQKGTTIPTGQVGNEFLENFDTDDFWINEDGSHYLVSGDLTGDTGSDDVVVVDGAVVLQEGNIIPGSGFVQPIDINGIVNVHMDPAGNWFARGNNEDEQDWVVRNGVVIAKGGDPIFSGSSEHWDDSQFSDLFFLHVGNSRGEYVLGGVTDGPILSNGVLVFYGLNQSYVIAREGDPVDIDGNGLYDDDAYFNTFGNDDLGSALMDENGMFYIVANLKNGENEVIGQGVFRMNCYLANLEITFNTVNLINFNDPCNCNQVLRVNNSYYFGDTLIINTEPGADITFFAPASSDFYDENGQLMANGTTFTEVSSGVYQLAFYKLIDTQPVAFISINGGIPIEVDPNILEVCTLADCPVLIPTMGQWSLILLGLLTLILGLVHARQSSLRTQKH